MKKATSPLSQCASSIPKSALQRLWWISLVVWYVSNVFFIRFDATILGLQKEKKSPIKFFRLVSASIFGNFGVFVVPRSLLVCRPQFGPYPRLCNPRSRGMQMILLYFQATTPIRSSGRKCRSTSFCPRFLSSRVDVCVSCGSCGGKSNARWCLL